MAEKKPLLVRAQDITATAQSFSHPWNPHSLITGTRLAPLVGLQRTGVSVARMPPGKESFVYHSHHREEEWVYILSGRGIAEIDGEEFEVRLFAEVEALRIIRNKIVHEDQAVTVEKDEIGCFFLCRERLQRRFEGRECQS